MLSFVPSDRQYISWEWKCKETNNTIIGSSNMINPLKEKLLVSDEINNDGTIYLLSPYRSKKDIPGILVLSGQTYGRYKNKLLYKCIPNDKYLPCFLIPYENKKTSFNKNLVNKYVLFKFSEWTSKHPIGTLNNILGNVDIPENFYNYQLYCKDLFNIGLKEIPTKWLKEVTKESFIDDILAKSNIEDRTSNNIFSIDPEDCQDYDDALGIIEIDGGYILSIYISNVAIYIESLDLWDKIIDKIATIYLPDKKISMLPKILSENLCSLQEKKRRFALALDITVINNEIVNYNFNNVIIKLDKNYIYDESELLLNSDYLTILNLTKHLNNSKSYLQYINNSHDLVEYYMILMNHIASQNLCKFKNGIYRSVTGIMDNKYDNLSQEVKQFMKMWKGTSGKYTNFNNKEGHNLISDGLDSYLHITSPIRRIVDLINIIIIQQNNNLYNFGHACNNFVNQSMEKLNDINIIMKKIKQVQNDCLLLSKYINNTINKDIIYEGYIIEKEKEKNEYTVYISKIKFVTKIKLLEELELYNKYNFTIHLLMDENTLKKKIRLQVQL